MAPHKTEAAELGFGWRWIPWALSPSCRQVIKDVEILQTLEAVPTYNKRPTVACKIINCGTFNSWFPDGFLACCKAEHYFPLSFSQTMMTSTYSKNKTMSSCSCEWLGNIFFWLKKKCSQDVKYFYRRREKDLWTQCTYNLWEIMLWWLYSYKHWYDIMTSQTKKEEKTCL